MQTTAGPAGAATPLVQTEHRTPVVPGGIDTSLVQTNLYEHRTPVVPAGITFRESLELEAALEADDFTEFDRTGGDQRQLRVRRGMYGLEQPDASCSAVGTSPSACATAVRV